MSNAVYMKDGGGYKIVFSAGEWIIRYADDNENTEFYYSSDLAGSWSATISMNDPAPTVTQG